MLLELLLEAVTWMDWSWAFWRFLFSPGYRAEVRRWWNHGSLSDRIVFIIGALFAVLIGLLPIAIGIAILGMD